MRRCVPIFDNETKTFCGYQWFYLPKSHKTDQIGTNSSNKSERIKLIK